MQTLQNDAAMIQVLAHRLAYQRVPAANAIKKRVDKGAPLTTYDIQYLTEVFQEAQRLHPMIDRFPEWHPLVIKMLSLYRYIVNKGYENEVATSVSRHQDQLTFK